MSRVERHREDDVTHALNEIIFAVGHPLDTRAQIQGIRNALQNLYTSGANWGEQDGYDEAVQARVAPGDWEMGR